MKQSDLTMFRSRTLLIKSLEQTIREMKADRQALKEAAEILNREPDYTVCDEIISGCQQEITELAGINLQVMLAVSAVQDERMQKLLELKYLNGMSNRETAEAIGIEPGSGYYGRILKEALSILLKDRAAA